MLQLLWCKWFVTKFVNHSTEEDWILTVILQNESAKKVETVIFQKNIECFALFI